MADPIGPTDQQVQNQNNITAQQKSQAEYANSWLASIKEGQNILSESLVEQTSMTEKLASAAESMSSHISKTFKDIGETGKSFEGIRDAFKKIDDYADKTGKSLSGWTKAIAKAKIATKATGKAFTESFRITKNFFAPILEGAKKVFGKVSSVFGKVFQHPAIQGIMAIGKVMATVFFQSLKYATRFVKFMVSLPLKIAGAAAKIGNSLRNDLVMTIGTAVEATKEMFDISEQYGSGAGSAIKSFADSASSSMLEFRDITSESVKLFGEGAAGIAARAQAVSQRLSEMGVYADIFGESLKSSTDGSATQFTFMEKSLRILGMTAEDVAYTAQEAVKSGVGINKILLDTQISLKNVAKSSGVNAKMISKNFNVLRKDIINFGHMSTEQLQETSAALVKMGLSAQDAASMFGKLDTFESSAQMAAMLSQSFGMNLDALKLIKAENPEEIFEDLRNSMMATGRSFNELNRHEKSLMAATTGLSGASLKALMDFRDAGMTYDEAMQKMKENSPEEKQLKAFNEMTGSLKEIKNIMQDTSFFSSFFKGLRTSIVLASGLGEKFMKVSKRIQDFFIAGLDFGKDKKFMKSIRGAFKPIEDTIDRLVGKGGADKGLFDTNLLQSAVKPFFKDFSDILGSVFKDDGNTLEVQKNLLNKIKSIFDFDKMMSNPNNPATTLLKTGGKLVGQLIKGFTALAPSLIEIVKKSMNGVVDFLWDFTSDTTSDNSIKGMLFDLFGLDNNDQLALANTVQSLVDLLTSSAGPFSKLFLWINSKVLGMVTDIGSNLGNAILNKVSGGMLGTDASEITESKLKGLKEATAGKKGFKDLDSIAKSITDSTGYFNDDEKELARFGGQLEFVLEKIRTSGSAKQKKRLEDYFKQVDLTQNSLLNVDELDTNYKAVNELVDFLKTGNANKITFRKKNDLWDDFANLFGYGKQAVVKVKGGKTEITQLNEKDKVIAGMKGGDIENAISEYAGIFTMNILNGIASDLISTPVRSNQQVVQTSSNQQSQRPIELVINMDGKVVAKQLVAADIVGIAKNPAYAGGATVLKDGTTRNQSGGSSEMSAV
jgi:hypothetical protein